MHSNVRPLVAARLANKRILAARGSWDHTYYSVVDGTIIISDYGIGCRIIIRIRYASGSGARTENGITNNPGNVGFSNAI